jgi:predicted nucleic acid-binding protein
MTHLDTSFVIRALVHGSAEDRALRSWIKTGTPLGMSAVGWAELLCGPLKEEHVPMLGRLVGEIVPLDAERAELAAQLFNRTGRRRGTLADCMIAATAMHADAALATSNRADFARFVPAGLRLAEAAA